MIRIVESESRLIRDIYLKLRLGFRFESLLSIDDLRKWRNLADAPDLGSGGVIPVGVRVPPFAPLGQYILLLNFNSPGV